MRGRSDRPRRLRSTSVRLGAVAVLALGFAPACASDNPEEVCVDEYNRVVEDYHCDDDDDDYSSSSGSYHYYYLPSGSRRPKVGEQVSGGSRYKSSVTRNGYGSSYRGGSGS